ncbi:aminodeoxychorismate synthase component I [Kaarinaea lacus]
MVLQIDSDIDLICLHQLNPQHYPYLLESALKSESDRHFDVLFAFPKQTLALTNSGLTLKNHDTVSSVRPDSFVPEGGSFLEELDRWWQLERTAQSNQNSQLPFHGGWFVFLSYELAAEIEPTLTLPENPLGEPLAFASRIPVAVVKDHHSGLVYIVAEDGYQDLIVAVQADIKKMLQQQPPLKQRTVAKHNVSIEEENSQTYLHNVEHIKRYIKNGDVFQVNLSRLWQANFEQSPHTAWLYRRLRQHNPSPFFGLALFNNCAIISSSPERLIRVRDDIVETRPIAGTRPRGRGDKADKQLSEELFAHPKERAEHIMLIDLERNDLGRVCVPGSIKVNELMVLESYTHVHHIVSNVRGQLYPNTSPASIIKAVFPGGTITGCPKVRCMEIIAELEATGRGAYTGSMGYINLDGSMDMNILIRTMVQCDNRLHFRAGAGIVADSIAANELEETRAKARGIIKALTE